MSETTNHAVARAEPALPRRLFARHLLEMVAAMLVGMAVLEPAAAVVFARAGRADLYDSPEISALVMATAMTAGMTAWMKIRRHGWAATAEMAAAMYLPFAALLVPFWAGAISGGTVLIAGHFLMLPAMALVMLRRRAEYSTDHRRVSR